jgi:hypothetical protein
MSEQELVTSPQAICEVDLPRDLPLPADVSVEKQRATELDDPPQYECRSRVKVQGERLHKTLWRGHQWAVTTYGVERRDGTYVIAKNRLWENEEKYGWVRHMADKSTWCNLSDFVEALRIARRLQAARII